MPVHQFSPDRMRCVPWLRWAWLTMALGACQWAEAQSSYTLSVLNQRVASRPIAGSVGIDPLNRVRATATVITRYTIGGYGASSIFQVRPVYGDIATEWVASSASTVSPTNLFTNATRRWDQWLVMSPDGKQVVVMTADTANGSGSGNAVSRARGVADTGPGPLFKAPDVANTVSGAGVLGGLSIRPVAINNSGRVVANMVVDAAGASSNMSPGLVVDYDDSDHSCSYAYRGAVWVSGQLTQVLERGSYAGSAGKAINSAGTVAGLVLEPDQDGKPIGQANYRDQCNTHAAIWVGGSLQVIDAQPGTGSVAVAINDAGQVLVRVRPVTSVMAPGYSPDLIWDLGDPSYALYLNGQTTPITPNVVGQVIQGTPQLNGAGVVVGSVGVPMTPRPAPYGLQVEPFRVPDATLVSSPSRRAFIWKNGVMTDLGAWVSTRGIKLAAGAYFQDVLGFNDQGSLVVSLMDAKGALSVVRLTAKP